MYNNCVQNKTRDANHIHALLTAAYTLLSADIHKIPAACEEPANADVLQQNRTIYKKTLYTRIYDFIRSKRKINMY